MYNNIKYLSDVVVLRLVMKGETVYLCLGERLNVMFGMGDHQMAIEVYLWKTFSESEHYGWTYGEIRYEMS